MEFINRSSELYFVQHMIEQDSSKTSICFSTRNASGFTSFCKKVEFSYETNEILPIYIDGGDKSGYTVYSNTFEKIWKKDKRLFNKYLGQYAIAEPGSAARNTAAALAGIPFVGNLLGEPFKQVSESTRFLRQGIHLQESFLKLVASLTKKRNVLFLIDNLQLLDNWSVSLLESVEDAELNINYIFGQCVTKGGEHESNLLTKLSSKGRVIIHKTFDPPDIKFIKEIANYIGTPVTNGFANDLIYESEGNLYKILARLRNNKSYDQQPQNDVQVTILKVLSICSQPIKRTDIIALVSNLPDHYLLTETIINGEFERLRISGNLFEIELPDGDALVKLKSYSVAEALVNGDILGNQLYLYNHIYEYYSNAWKYSLRHSKSEIALMLYRIARKVAPNDVKRHALNIIKISFALGTSERAKHFIDDVIDIDHPSDETEFYLCVTFHIAYRRYEAALNLIRADRFQKFLQSNFYEIAKAICLERCRQYLEFDSVLNRLLPISTIHEEGILRVHQINCLVHNNKLTEAGELLTYCIEKLTNAFAFPYILRSATSIYSPEKSEPFLKRAIRRFKANGDDFGYATSMANMGLLQIEKGKYHNAITVLKECKAILMIYGIHHLNIVENSLGLAMLNLGLYQNANDRFNKGLELSSGEMSRLYFNLNLSITDCLIGNSNEALNRLIGFEDFVINYPVDRVRQKYYTNMACVAILSKRDETEIDRLLGQMVRYPDRKYPERTVKLAARYRALYSNFQHEKIDLSYFSPCYLEYWYSNPLADLTMESLPNEALI